MIRKPHNVRFGKIHILIVDSDSCLSQAVAHTLRAMGFGNVQHVKTASDAVRIIRAQPVSFLITEWDIKGSSGVDLVRFLRRSPDSPNRSIPIIMLTARGEIHDVEYARDMGITEFVVKPFSAHTLFSRIERIIDQPRGFVVANAYVGPERRRRGLPPPGMADRRTIQAVVSSPSPEAFKAPPGSPPLVFPADYSIRQTLGGGQPLAALITPEILKDAQKAIAALGEDSLQWIREDLAALQRASAALQKLYSAMVFEALLEATLSIKARAGTFDYSMASDVARLLFLFLSADFSPTNPRHLIIIDKHIQVLTVIFAQKIKERAGLGAELYSELERLIQLHK